MRIPLYGSVQAGDFPAFVRIDPVSAHAYLVAYYGLYRTDARVALAMGTTERNLRRWRKQLSIEAKHGGVDFFPNGEPEDETFAPEPSTPHEPTPPSSDSDPASAEAPDPSERPTPLPPSR